MFMFMFMGGREGGEDIRKTGSNHSTYHHRNGGTQDESNTKAKVRDQEKPTVLGVKTTGNVIFRLLYCFDRSIQSVDRNRQRFTRPPEGEPHQQSSSTSTEQR